jgi:hypothetical protein
MAWSWFRQGIACLVIFVFAGCSTTATVSRLSGPECEADILDSEAHSLHVRDGYGRDFRVPAEDVADIDHPGNVRLLIGLGLVAMSVPLMVGDLAQRNQRSDQRSEWSGMGLAIGIPELVTGLALAIPGWLRYRHSKRAAQAFEDAHPILPIPRPAYVPSYPYGYPAR